MFWIFSRSASSSLLWLISVLSVWVGRSVKALCSFPPRRKCRNTTSWSGSRWTSGGSGWDVTEHKSVLCSSQCPDTMWEISVSVCIYFIWICLIVIIHYSFIHFPNPLVLLTSRHQLSGWDWRPSAVSSTNVSTADFAVLLRNECGTTSTGAWATWKRIFSCCATTLRPTTWRALRWSHMVHSAVAVVVVVVWLKWDC